MRVLVVEDDAELAGLLRDGLRDQRIDPTLATSFADGRERAIAGNYDVVILDVRLPGGTGFDLCGELRRKGVATPVLMLTALDAVDDRVRGLEVGAISRSRSPSTSSSLDSRRWRGGGRCRSRPPSTASPTWRSISPRARSAARAGRSR